MGGLFFIPTVPPPPFLLCLLSTYSHTPSLSPFLPISLPLSLPPFISPLLSLHPSLSLSLPLVLLPSFSSAGEEEESGESQQQNKCPEFNRSHGISYDSDIPPPIPPRPPDTLPPPPDTLPPPPPPPTSLPPGE